MSVALDSAMQGRRRRPGGGRTRPGGFTLVEILVIILIIGILVAASVPTLARVRVQVWANNSQAVVNLLHAACLQYHAQTGEYPSRLENLVQELIGYQPAGTWDADGKRYVGGDGKDGYGWRPWPRGPVHGPFNGAEGLKREKRQYDGGVTVFLEAFGQPVLYSRYAAGWQSLTPFGGPKPDEELDSYLKGEGGKYFRTDFVLISPGPNGKWDPYYSGTAWTTSDDITNLLKH